MSVNVVKTMEERGEPCATVCRGTKESGNPWRLAWLAAGMVAVNALLTYTLCHHFSPRVVSFDMKGTVDAFFDSVSQRSLNEEQSRKLSARFNQALETSLLTWSRQHSALILVSPAVVQGAPEITVEIQQDIARRMRKEL